MLCWSPYDFQVNFSIFFGMPKDAPEKMWIPGSPIDDGFTGWLRPKTQWFCWSLSLWKMAISLGRLTQHFQTNPKIHWVDQFMFAYVLSLIFRHPHEGKATNHRKSKAHCPWHKARRCTGQFLVLVLHSSAQQGTGRILKKRLQQPLLR